MEKSDSHQAIQPLTPQFEKCIRANPLLNIDTFIIPSPYIKNPLIRKDYGYSYIWLEEGEILGYMITYSAPGSQEYLIYKIVSSPYGRGRGIGTAFISHLAASVPENSNIYLYVWAKQQDTVDFFQQQGFVSGESIVYQNLVYFLMSASSAAILNSLRQSAGKKAHSLIDEIGRTRHDARKILSSLNAMVNALAPENAGRIIEDISRESLTLVNMLNLYRDSVNLDHEVNLRDLIFERVVPYVDTAQQEVELVLRLSAVNPVVMGNWLNIGRALVNLVSNAIDAMAETSRKSRLEITLKDNPFPALHIADNGPGISKERMKPDSSGRPAFVGKSTKEQGKGEGLGTVQVWNTFGSERLTVKSTPGKGTEWIIRFERSVRVGGGVYPAFQRQFHEFRKLRLEKPLTPQTSRTDVITAIWQMRKQELFMFDLLDQFSRRHNIRDLYRIILSYFQNVIDDEELKSHIRNWNPEHNVFKTWLSVTARRVQRRRLELENAVDLSLYRAALLRSYGQYQDKVIIFTLNPYSGEFLATSRKLAEHLDFVPYLGGDREAVLRGEFVGDMNNDTNPIYLGLWAVNSLSDLPVKLALLQKGAQCLLDMGLHPEKRLAFYQSTHVRCSQDINADASTTLQEFVRFSAEQLIQQFTRESEDELQGYITALD